MSQQLSGLRVALAEARELDLLARMLEQEGAEIIRCPLVSICDSPDTASVEAWLRRVIAGQCADVIFYTGEGLRRLLSFAERAGLQTDFVAALKRVRKITRGPKPVRALREVGLSSDLTASTPTTDGLIATLAQEDLQDRSVGVQAYGAEANAQLIGFLREKGARVDVVAPYVYASDADDAQVRALINDMAAGRIDAIAFTSSPQVQRIAEVAKKSQLDAALKQGLARTKIAAIGPIVAQELSRHGMRADVMPEKSFTMKPLVRAIGDLFSART
jgi:uroporphyrinogen-III synthase